MSNVVLYFPNRAHIDIGHGDGTRLLLLGGVIAFTRQVQDSRFFQFLLCTNDEEFVHP